MAIPCSNNPDEVIEKVVSVKANADKFDAFVNGTDTQTVQLGSGNPTPTIRNAIRQIMADASWAKEFIADAPDGDVSLNNAAAMNTSASRTLAERFGEVINVRDFGAKGDGVTDDTEAIRAAVEYSRTLSWPKTIVGFGEFVISGQIRLRAHHQAVYFTTIKVGAWTDPVFPGDETEYADLSAIPAILATAQGVDIYIGNLDLGRFCAGICLSNSGCTVRDGTNIWHYRTYGLTWTAGGCYVGAVSIVYGDSRDSDYTDWTTPRPPCLLVDGPDSKVVGMTAGWGNPTVKLTANATLNFFTGCHFWTGSSASASAGVMPVDPTLIESHASSSNVFVNCYFDSGLIKMYDYGMKIIGGAFLNNASAVSMSPPYVRYYAKASIPNGANTGQISSVASLVPGYYDYNGNSWPNDSFSRINNIVSEGNLPLGALVKKANCERIIYDGHSIPVKETFSADNILSEHYVVGNSDHVIRVQRSNYHRYYINNTLGYHLFVGDQTKNVGIGASGVNSGVLHLCAGGDNGDGTYNVLTINKTNVNPKYTNTTTLGSDGLRFKDLYVSSSTISTSDERLKQNIEQVPDALLDAWENVGFILFKFKSSVQEKGEKARTHSGLIAQEIMKAFSVAGLDAADYGLFCHSSWDEEWADVVVVDKAAVMNADGCEVEPEVSHTERKKVQEAGDCYSLRYVEALCIEAAYQRRENIRLRNRIAAIEARLNEISGNGTAPFGVSPDNL